MKYLCLVYMDEQLVDAMPVDECARLIADGMRARRREVVMGARGRIGLWLKLVAPAVVDRMARAALARRPEAAAPNGTRRS